jgi:hypothetical protein
MRPALNFEKQGMIEEGNYLMFNHVGPVQEAIERDQMRVKCANGGEGLR